MAESDRLGLVKAVDALSKTAADRVEIGIGEEKGVDR
jgi:hypothetical protein